MRIGSVPDASQQLLLMLAAAQRQPALIRRRKQPLWKPEPEDFLRFCDVITAQANARSLAEEKIAESVVE
jgi:hypothetical protein